MTILAAFLVRETAKLLEQPQVPPQTIKLALPFVAASKLEARLNCGGPLRRLWKRAFFRVVKWNQKQAPQLHISWGLHRNPKRPGPAAATSRSPWLHLGPVPRRGGPYDQAGITYLFPIYYLFYFLFYFLYSFLQLPNWIGLFKDIDCFTFK